jgi:hypothetical protein
MGMGIGAIGARGDMTTTNENKLLRFVFCYGTPREWRPMKEDSSPPTGMVYEVLSLPGRLVGWGSTREEATKHLQNTLDAVMHRLGGPSKWYQDAFAAMDKKAAEVFWSVWKDMVCKTQQPTGVWSTPDLVKAEFAKVENFDLAECVGGTR